ncbi:MAG: preprotein translocase subunit YajC [Planctomycetes bacterium]|nr:preprotein translocase subunit YajC [Planctomycetota bacterium]
MRGGSAPATTPAAPADTGGGQPGGGSTGGGSGQDLGSCLSQQAPFILLFVAIFYLLLWRPQQKEQRRVRELLAALKKGDRVITSAGLHGVVQSVEERVVRLVIDRDVTVTIERSSIQRLIGDDAAAAKSAPSGSGS